jgi:hypothetical protein
MSFLDCFLVGRFCRVGEAFYSFPEDECLRESPDVDFETPRSPTEAEKHDAEIMPAKYAPTTRQEFDLQQWPFLVHERILPKDNPLPTEVWKGEQTF